MATKTGLHLFQETETIYKQRAGITAGGVKYKAKGDVQSNSPGDYNQLVLDANAFQNNPAADRYTKLNSLTVAVPEDDKLNWKMEGTLAQSAAFLSRISGVTTYNALLKSEMLTHYVGNPALNFNDTAKWSRSSKADADPFFTIFERMTAKAFEFDYSRSIYSTPEQAQVNAWFESAGNYSQILMDRQLNPRFVDRLNGNYTLTTYSKNAQANDPKEPLFYGGPLAGWFHRGYNNRNASAARFCGTVGLMLNNANLQAAAKRYFFEFIRYSVFPGNYLADLHRWFGHPSEPEKGLNYAFSAAQCMIDLAMAFAFAGDFSLVNFVTEEGAYGSESPGQPKSLLGVIQTLQGFLNGSQVKYATSVDPATLSVTDRAKVLINGNDPYASPGNIAFDSWFALPNLYYQNAGVKSNYLRQAAGTSPYPASTRNCGPHSGWKGHGGLYPGILFLFGQMEGLVDFFTQGKTPQTINFLPISNKVFGDQPFALQATAGSGLAVTFSIVSGPASIAGSQLTITGAGEVKVRASQAGNGTYEPAPDKDITFSVAKAAQTVSFTAITDKQLGVDTTLNLVATASSGAEVSFQIAEGPGSINGSTYTLSGLGTVKIRASVAGDDNYQAASAERSFSVLPGAPVVASNILAGKTYTKAVLTPEFAEPDLTNGQYEPAPGSTLFAAEWNAAAIGTPKTVNKLVIRFNQPVKEFMFLRKVGSDWVELVSLTDNKQLTREFIIPPTSVAELRYVGVNKHWSKVSEIEAYGY